MFNKGLSLPLAAFQRLACLQSKSVTIQGDLWHVLTDMPDIVASELTITRWSRLAVGGRSVGNVRYEMWLMSPYRAFVTAESDV